MLKVYAASQINLRVKCEKLGFFQRRSNLKYFVDYSWHSAHLPHHWPGLARQSKGRRNGHSEEKNKSQWEKHWLRPPYNPLRNVLLIVPLEFLPQPPVQQRKGTQRRTASKNSFLFQSSSLQCSKDRCYELLWIYLSVSRCVEIVRTRMGWD